MIFIYSKYVVRRIYGCQCLRHGCGTCQILSAQIRQQARQRRFADRLAMINSILNQLFLFILCDFTIMWIWWLWRLFNSENGGHREGGPSVKDMVTELAEAVLSILLGDNNNRTHVNGAWSDSMLMMFFLYVKFNERLTLNYSKFPNFT